MKDKELKLEEIEVTHTLGGAWRPREREVERVISYSATDRYTIVIWSRRNRREDCRLVV